MPAANPNNTNLVNSVSFSSDLLIDALIGGTKWGGATGTGATIYYSFPTSSSPTYWSSTYYNQANIDTETRTGFSALNSTQQLAASSALQSWANVANITIEQVTETAVSVGDIRFAFTSNPFAMDFDTYAYAYYPDLTTPFGGDIWLNPNPPTTGANYNLGAKGYQTLLHEIGHALGLDHSFDSGFGDVYLPYQYEQYQYSVMSYSDTAATNDNGYSGYYPTTPMLMDIQAIQYIYGANMSYHTGDDVYVFHGGLNYYETIWDAGGNDTIRYVSNTGGTIDLNAGKFSQLGAPFLVAAGTVTHYDNVAIAFNVTIENAIGGNGSDWLIGNNANNSLTGGAGADVIKGGAGADTMDGGVGYDTFEVDNEFDIVTESLTFAQGGGIDMVNSSASFTLGDNVENLTLFSFNTINGTGNTLNNRIIGNTRANSLNGGAGNDTMYGGLGNDTYVVDSILDIIAEDIGGGIDTVQASVSRTLGLNFDNLTLLTVSTDPLTLALNNINAIGNELANVLIGNIGNNILSGGLGTDTLQGDAGDDTLNGGVGNDNMDGGDGDDIYLVNSLLDITTETNADSGTGGNDEVRSNVNHILKDNFEKLTLLTVSIDPLTLALNNINGTGNGLNNTLIGNGGNNILNGLNGDDSLNGGAGNDSLDGGAGADTMEGGAGNDIYVVDDALDTVTETLTIAQLGGIDTIKSTISYTLGDNVDRLILTDGSLNGGSAFIDGTGNTLANIITGNAGNNILTGNDGNDTLTGNAGNDSLYGGVGNDTLSGGADVDLLDGGTGNDSMNGGLGSDTYFVDSILDVLTEGATFALGGGSDTVQSTVTRTLGLNFDNLILMGANNINAIGNELDNLLTGNDGNNIINGGLGADTLNGGLGNDTLDGGAGIDSLIGGDGDDTYRLDFVAITINSITTIELQDLYELDSAGNDTVAFRGVIANTNYQDFYLAGTTIENFDFSATGLTKVNLFGDEFANKLIGNAANNSITGGDGNDTLNGGLGLDTLIGGAGDDTYFVGNLAEINLTGEILGGGIDTLNVGFTHSLNDNFEKLTLLTVSIDPLTLALNNINGTGNGLNNTLIGNGGNNILNGLNGDDALNGGAGNDTLNGGNGLDSLLGGAGNDSLDGGTGADAMEGGIGNDIYVVDDAADMVTELLTIAQLGGIDTVKSSLLDYTLTNQVENLTLIGLATDNISGTGNTLNNIIIGDGGNNKLSGLNGNDSLTDGLGNDTLIGGLGNDTMNGGAGQDVFVFDTALNALTNKDTILGFNVVDDQIQLDATIFSAIGATLDANEFRSGAGITTAATVDQHIIFNSTTGALYYDADGVGVQAATQFATLTGTVGTLTNNDFLLTNANLTGLALTGTIGSDTLIGGAGNDIISGGSGEDILIGELGLDILDGGVWTDTYVFLNPTEHQAAEIADSGFGDIDEVRFASITAGATLTLFAGDTGIETVVIGTGTGLVAVTSAITALNIEASGVLNGLYIKGNWGNNSLTGTSQNDTLDGGAGGADTLIGGQGNDILIGRFGNNTLNGGEGSDTYIFSVSTEHTVAEIADNGNTGDDEIRFTSQNLVDTLTLFTGDTGIERIVIGTGTGAVAYTGGTSFLNINAAAITNTLTITGNSGNNSITGGLGNDTIYGGDDSLLFGNLGHDTLHGGQGNDTLYGLDGDSLYGDQGNDSLIGMLGIQTLIGGIGNDTLDGGEGGDVYIFNAGSEHVVAEITDSGLLGVDELRFAATVASTLTIFAGDIGLEKIVIGTGTGTVANSSLYINNNVDASAALNGLSIIGNVGDNNIIGTIFNDNLNGGSGISGNDTLIGGQGNDTISGGGGSDVLVGGAGFDLLDGGEDSDVYVISSLDEYLPSEISDSGTVGSDIIVYTANIASTLNLYAEDSGIEGVVVNSGNEYPALGTENININATAYSNGLGMSGNNGNNSLIGTAFNDVIAGNYGNDTIIGGAGTDSMDGGFGDDLYIITDATHHNTSEIHDLTGIDELRFAATFASTLNLYIYDSGIENIVIGTGASAIADTTGTIAINIDATYFQWTGLNITGNAGNNNIIGSYQNDTINGGLGDDFIRGYGGNNLLTGGAGADTFMLESWIGYDAVTDFTSSVDKIQLFRGDYTTLNLGSTLLSTEFVSGASAVAGDSSDRIIYDTSTGALYYDADGSGAGVSYQIATLVGNSTLVASDFTIV